MQHSEILVALAQLAVALAGFASIVSVLGNRQSGDSYSHGGSRLRLLLEMGLRNAPLRLFRSHWLRPGMPGLGSGVS
jgi:hypothetical protein